MNAPAGGSVEVRPDEEPGRALLVGSGLRLKRIELVGFKSFRDRTVITLPAGITGIVGPNGCGKSNVVDAIRWTLGEQSVKRLRGESLEELVFCGNENHGPVGMAQVAILFECDGLPQDPLVLRSDGRNSAAGAPFSEIMVTRRYFRSGESEYLVNNIPCRLRDITELFLGTGVGSKAYAVIEQGRVEQLLNAKPEDIRVLIEEAAGVTLYRSRRMAAERKMERTRENLVRVEDILREVERQIHSLRRQSKRAEKYRQYKQELEQLDLWLGQMERWRCRGKLWDVEADRAAMLGRMGGAEEALERLEERIESLRGDLEAKHALVRAREADAIRAQANVSKCEQQINFVRARIAATELELDQARLDRQAAAEKLQEIESGVSATEGELSRAAAARDGARSRMAQLEKTLASASAELAEAERELEEAKVRAFDCLAGESRASNAKDAAASQYAEIQERLEKAAKLLEAAERECSEVAARHKEAGDSLRRIQNRVQELEGAKREAARALERALQERRTWQSVEDGLEESLRQTSSRLESLRELCESMQGCGEGVRRLKNAGEGVGCELVAEVFEVPESLERPISALLGERLQCLIVEDHAAALKALDLVQSSGGGRATLIPKCPRGGANGWEVPSGARRLSDLVTAGEEQRQVIEYLMGDALLVPDIESALAIWRGNGSAWTLVTSDGEIVDPGGVISGGSDARPEQRLLSQRRILRELEEQLRRYQGEVAGAKRRSAELDRVVQGARGGVEGIDREVDELALNAVRGEKDLERLGLELRRATERAESLRVEKSELGGHGSRAAGGRESAERALSEAAKERQEADERLSLRLNEEQSLRRYREEISGQMTDATVSLVKAEERVAACQARLEDLAAARDDNLLRRRRTEERLARDREGLDADRSRVHALVEELETLRVAERSGREAARAAGSEAQAVSQLLLVAGSEREKAQADLRELRQRLGDLEVQRTERRLAIGHLEETIRERYGADLPEGDCSAEGIDAEATRARVAELRDRLAGMGEVGTAALDELQELAERKEFLSNQKGDLERSLEDLRRTVSRLNRTCRERFRETFDQVRTSFEAMFPKLFPGGRATLRLTNEESGLDAGVEVSVQPPGKRLGSLDLLSGGEKALTAVSLIFALFFINPSPFCVLDEVDAPLDDANIGRFNAMVSEMSKRSQFVLITHNKRTMEVADTLYGVTMEEPGISKMVSVRLPE